MSDIKVNIIGEFNKKGFDDADKATKKLTRSFQKLGATIGVALSARAFFNFAKQGAIAFAAEEKAIKQLTNSLANLGFAYSVPAIERYLEATEQATMVTKEEMRPAIANLITTTMDAEKSMQLLATAIDASVETGQDLTSVTSAITKAYTGNYAALAKLTRGYSSAQLKALGFEKSVQVLADRFEGSAAAATDTYSFKIAQFQKAVGDAQKAIGEGLIKSIEQLGSGDYNEGLQDLVDIGNQIGVAFQYAAGAAQTLKDAYDFITLRGVRDLTMDLLGKTQPARGGAITPTQLELVKANIQRQKELTLQKKIIAERKKAAALTEKEKKDQLALNKAKAVFDLEKIQIEAALKGKITDEERTRLLLMKAILNEDADTATKLTERLKEMQQETMKLANMLTSFPKANDPFVDWLKTLEKLQLMLGSILSMTSPTTLAIQASASAGNAAMLRGDAYAAEAMSGEAMADAILALEQAQNALTGATTPTEVAAATEGIRAANNAMEAAGVLAESAAALGLAAAAADLMASRDLFAESVAGARAAGVPESQIIVNVEGSVIAAEDLAETITDIQYNFQKTGKGLLYSSTAI